MLMKKLPVIIERTKTQARAMAFKYNMLSGNFEQARTCIFESADFDKQNEELNVFIKEHFFDNAGIYINLPPEELILREFSLPFVARGKIRELLPFELESQLPYEISEIFYDYHAYPDEVAGKTRVVAAACRKKFLESYIQFFLQNSHELKGVYIPNDALLQLTSFLEEPSGCILYMSASYTVYFIVEDGAWIFSRVVPLGYDALFDGIAKSWDMDTSESKKILTEIPVSDSDIVDFEYYRQKFKLSKAKSRELVESILSFSGKVNHELKATIRSHYQDIQDVKNLVLMSDLDNQVFLENILAEKISLSINPFPYGHTPISLIGRPYVILVGMANSITSNRFINLMDTGLKKLFKKKKDHRDKFIYAILFFSALLFCASFAINVMQKQKNYSILQNRKKELFVSLFNKNPDDQVSMASQAALLVEEQKKRSEIFKLQSNKVKLSLVLFELNKALVKSGSLQVERLVYSNNVVTVSGTAEDFKELNNIKTLVLDNTIFSEADMKDQRSYLAPDGRNRARFTLVIKPKPPEE